MARTIAAIQQQITDTKNADPTLSASLTSSSNTAIWKLWTYIVAVCIWTLENLFDYHKGEVDEIINSQKPHTLPWYIMMARQFQYGITLPADSDVYLTTSVDPAVVIIKYAAAVELTNLVRIKVAKLSGSALAGLSGTELSAFTAYMNRIKDAGVRLQLTSGEPDNLQLQLNIFYDPLVLNSAGQRLDGTADTPVADAVNNFLANLPFNGLFVLNNLTIALQHIDGVRIGNIITAQANYAATPYVPIMVEYSPDAGYMILDEAYFNAHIAYIAHEPF